MWVLSAPSGIVISVSDSRICFLFRKEKGDSIGIAEAYGTSTVFAVNLRYYSSSAKRYSFMVSWVPMSMNAIKHWYFLRIKYLNFSPESQTIILLSNYFMFNEISVNDTA